MSENGADEVPASGNADLVYQFGEYRLDATEGLLRGERREVQLTPTVLEILLTLVESAGRIVEKQQFMDRVWPGRVVEEGNLARNISTLRKILDDDPQDPRHIQTIPRRGYRFIATVKARPVEATAAPGSEAHVTASRARPDGDPASPPVDRARWMSKRALPFALLAASALVAIVLLAASRTPPGTTAIAPPIRSLAVLPLEDMSDHPADGYFADGMTEALISNLNRIGTLKVISRTSAMRYRNTSKMASEIGQELGVQAVVEGSIMRAEGRVRITIRLVEAASERALWSRTFERDLGDVLALQSEIAQTIARRVQVAVTPEESRRLAAVPRVDQEAHEAYLKGLFFKNKHTVDSLNKAIEYFEQALETEPAFAEAYAAMADAYVSLASWQGPSRELWPKARWAAHRALEIDSTIAEAHAVLAGALLCHDLDQSAAESAFLRALELNPGDSKVHLRYAYSLMTQGRFEESLAEARRSLEQDPVSLENNMVLGAILYHAGRYDEALQQIRGTLELDDRYAPAQNVLGDVYLQIGRKDEAIVALERALALGGTPGYIGELGHAYGLAGRAQDALRQLEILEGLSDEGSDSAFGIALVYLGLGDTDQALAWLERAHHERDFRMIRLLVDPVWDGVREDPRFQQLLLRIGLQG